MIQNITFLQIKQPKLTISKKEVRVKLPEDISGNDQVKILTFFNDIVTQVGVPERTLRGILDVSNERTRIRMRTSDKKYGKYFYLHITN
jgi:hypothetical protein